MKFLFEAIEKFIVESLSILDLNAFFEVTFELLDGSFYFLRVCQTATLQQQLDLPFNEDKCL